MTFLIKTSGVKRLYRAGMLTLNKRAQLLTQNTFMRFLIQGGSSYLVVTTVTAGLHEIAMVSARVSAGIGLLVAFLINFFTLRVFVFRSQGTMHYQAAKFFGFSLFFRASEYLLFLILLYTGVYYLLGLTIVMLLVTILKYIFYKKFIFS